jgi:hypothetical protein
MFEDRTSQPRAFTLRLWRQRAQAQRDISAPERRRLKRIASKKRASLIAKLGMLEERRSCLVLDSSLDGFRLRGTVRLKRGQRVEVILDEDPLDPVWCSVVWVSGAGSGHEGEMGLETVSG